MRMRWLRLNTWQQIAIVLSVLWAIGAWLYTTNSFERGAKLISERMYDDCLVHRSEATEDCYNIMKQTHHVQMGLGRKQAAARALLPIPLAWIALWLVNRLVLWIRRGFQPAVLVSLPPRAPLEGSKRKRPGRKSR